MVTKIVLAVVSAIAVVLLLCVVSLNTRLQFAEKFMDERYKNAYRHIIGEKNDEQEDEK